MEGDGALGEQQHAQQAASPAGSVVERAVSPLDTISGADAQIVLDAPFYYHWPSGDLRSHACLSTANVVTSVWVAVAGDGGENLCLCAAIIWVVLEGNLIWQTALDSRQRIEERFEHGRLHLQHVLVTTLGC